MQWTLGKVDISQNEFGMRLTNKLGGTFNTTNLNSRYPEYHVFDR